MIVFLILWFAQDADDYSKSGSQKYRNGDIDGALADWEKAIALDPANLAKDHALAAYGTRAAQRQAKKDYDGAIADYTKVLEYAPDGWKSETIYNRGSVKEDKGDLDGSLADYNKALELDPKLERALYSRAQLKGRKRDWDGKIADLSKAIELGFRNKWTYNERSLARFMKGELDGALEDCAKALELDSSYAPAYRTRGVVKFSKRDWDGVIADFTKVIELGAGTKEIYFDRGQAKRSKGDRDGAIADYSKALELDPTFTPAYLQRGDDKRFLKDLDGAIADFSKVIELKPAEKEGYRKRADAHFLKKDYPAAIADMSKAIELAGGDPEAFKRRGDIYAAQGEKEKAVADYKKGIDINPRYEDAYFALAQLKSDSGDYAGALAELARLMDLAKSPSLYARRARFRLNAKDKKGAFDDYSEAIKIAPKPAPYYQLRGAAYQDVDDFDDAIADFTSYIELGSENVHYGQLFRSKARLGKRDYAGALKDATAALECNQKCVGCLSNRGIIHYAAGNLKEARIDLAKSFELYPKGTLACEFLWVVRAKLGEREEATRQVCALLDAMDPELKLNWEASALGFLAERVSAENLLKRATSSPPEFLATRSAEAHYLIGLKLLLDGDAIRGKQHFQKCFEMGLGTFYSRCCAQSEIGALDK